MASRGVVAALALAASMVCWLPTARADGCLTLEARACRLILPAPSGQSRSGGSAVSAPVQVGEVLPRGRYSIILDAQYYGLPPVSDGWVYMRVGPDAYRVDWRSHQVLERVTDRASANF